MNLFGTYGGLVEYSNDPEGVGRIKARVPSVYGDIASGDLPWALPAGLPAGGGKDSGLIDWIPEPGDRVWVRFLDGLPEKPIWEWANQTWHQRDEYAVRRNRTDPDDDSKPGARLTRHGHSVFFGEKQLILTTSQGYSVVIDDTRLAGGIQIRTTKGHFVELTDLGDAMTTKVKYWSALVQDFTVHSKNIMLEAGTQAEIWSPRINLGQEAEDPIIRKSDLQDVVDTLVTYVDSHVHGNGNNGSPTTPPLAPLSPIMAGKPTASETVFAK